MKTSHRPTGPRRMSAPRLVITFGLAFIAAACGTASQIQPIDDAITLFVGEETIVAILQNDFLAGPAELTAVENPTSGAVTAELAGASLHVIAHEPGEVSVGYEVTSGSATATGTLIVTVLASPPDPIPPDPTPTATAIARPTATAGPTPEPTATARPTPLPTKTPTQPPSAPAPTTPPTRVPPSPPTCSSSQVTTPQGCETRIEVTCSVSTHTLNVGENFTIDSVITGSSNVVITYHHGDGYSGSASLARYDAPGTYPVSVSWSAGSQHGEAACGSVHAGCPAVSGASFAPGCAPAPPVISVSCSVSATSLAVGENFTIDAVITGSSNVSITYHHGDGYSGSASLARYDAPGKYAVVVSWSAGEESGQADCGTVHATCAYPTTFVGGSCIQPVSAGCSLSVSTIELGGSLDILWWVSPAGALSSVNFDHGDGYVGPSSAATYFIVGTHPVQMLWQSGSQSGVEPCGSVTVTAPQPTTPISPG